MKVYEGLYCMSTRNFKKAADLFLDSISTFTTYELFTYDTFIFYTVLTSIITLDRVSSKQKVFNLAAAKSYLNMLPFFPGHFLIIFLFLGAKVTFLLLFVIGSGCSRDPDCNRKNPILVRVFEFSI